MRFFGARCPSNLKYIGAFGKVLGSVNQKWVPQNSTHGNLLGRQGVELLRIGSVRLPPEEKNFKIEEWS